MNGHVIRKSYLNFEGMKTINIIGLGNVGFHLALGLATSSRFRLQQIAVRSLEKAQKEVPKELLVADINALQPADITIISVTDGAIAEVSALIPYQNHLVVHTSGTSDMEVLSDKNRKGVLYPLQTFSRGKEINFKTVPFCLEAQQKADMELLRDLASSLSESVYDITSEQRKSLHVSAVYVSNFANHMYTIGSEICREHGVPFEILLPLIRETADKVGYMSPKEAQTGPAIRFDEKTLREHEHFLTNKTYKEIYQLITESIQNV